MQSNRMIPSGNERRTQMIKEKSPRDAVIVAYGRSAMAKAFKGSFSQMHPVEYGAQTLKGVLARLEHFDPELIDDVIVGCAMPENKMAYNAGRLIVQSAGLPDTVCAHTLTRFCSSGLQSIATAANAIKANEMDIIVAGGCEQMTGMNMKDTPTGIDEELWRKYPDAYITMGITAENVAERYHISRKDMEAMAVRSHKLAYEAQKAGKFEEEIVPVTAPFNGEKIVVTEDEGIRPETNMESLSSLTPCFKDGGLVTAATSSQMTDGAGFVVLMARETAEKLGYNPIARFVSFAVGGVPADVMGIGPTAAIPKILKRTGLTIDDMDVIELNEAFAAQALACIRILDLPIDKVNPNGGAMALGHPLGATGTFLTCKVLSELKRTGGKYGMVTMCIGGGMGAAGIFEMET